MMGTDPEVAAAILRDAKVIRSLAGTEGDEALAGGAIAAEFFHLVRSFLLT